MILNNRDLQIIRSKITFDIGNVLVNVDMNVFYNELVNTFVCYDLQSAINFTESIQNSLDLGIYNIEQILKLNFYNKIPTKSINRLKAAWYAVVTPCHETLEVVASLMTEGSSIALLSNIGFDHAEYLDKLCGVSFSKCIKHFSCYVGARKPTKLYYQSFILDNQYFSEINIIKDKAYKTLFLDDKLENIEAAKNYLDAKIFDINNYLSKSDAATDMIKIIRDI